MSFEIKAAQTTEIPVSEADWRETEFGGELRAGFASLTDVGPLHGAAGVMGGLSTSAKSTTTLTPAPDHHEDAFGYAASSGYEDVPSTTVLTQTSSGRVGSYFQGGLLKSYERCTLETHLGVAGGLQVRNVRGEGGAVATDPSGRALDGYGSRDDRQVGGFFDLTAGGSLLIGEPGYTQFQVGVEAGARLSTTHDPSVIVAPTLGVRFW